MGGREVGTNVLSGKGTARQRLEGSATDGRGADGAQGQEALRKAKARSKRKEAAKNLRLKDSQ